MTARFVRATGLPDSPLSAAAEFYARIVPDILRECGEGADVVVGFAPADHTHRAWRLAAVQELAREAAPCRVNGLVYPPDDPSGCAQAFDYLDAAPGVTGQVLEV